MARKRARRRSGRARCFRPLALRRTVPGVPEAAEHVLQEIMRALAGRKCPVGDPDEVRLALREALNNAVRHGSRLNPRKRIHVTCRCDARRGLSVTIRDEGAGFDPSEVPDPTVPENLERFSGRGLYMIRELMDEVEYRRGGRELRMRRRPRVSASKS